MHPRLFALIPAAIALHSDIGGLVNAPGVSLYLDVIRPILVAALAFRLRLSVMPPPLAGMAAGLTSYRGGGTL